MKFILQIILTAGLGYLAAQFLPFWGLAIVSVVVGFIFLYKNSLSSFLAGFIGAALLWGAYSFMIDGANQQLLSSQLGELFSISGSYLVYATGWLGGMIGGIGGMTGTLARKMLSSSSSSS